ncbi:DUF1707 SHOCT-like domain-containing protein [Saccharomonospora azurea]|uniref:DUF1707 domain-containing protein n=1 Tax=Saccharomonospora azurea NA-128 TaxID=882081 RepID=H8G5W0_9PSEU|nr:DUF1707 domain-containing protein [Saccharomonospora azurea]EHK88297.1 hypothetical protein SZMC14600_06326 [Saccharomonospora azurea SZMC 14600]EHY90272.1 protein of unknown function (DUF1707) [Saccharomonospora azurea NA-128]
MAVDRPNFRLSDAERAEALDALAEHVRTGRLDLAEYDERSATVTAAKTRGDLLPAFADLPDPRPSVLGPERTPEAVSSPAPPAPTVGQRLSSMAVPAAAVLAAVFFFTMGRFGFFIFVLPIVVALVMGVFARRRP